MSAHALLSPSSASRWLACTPSARAEENIQGKYSEAASEGTLAHSLAELMLLSYIGQINKQNFSIECAKIYENELYSDDMQSYCQDYASYVIEQYVKAKFHTKDALLEIEVKLNLTDYVKEGFGTGDSIIIADGVLDIIDLKYGKGVLVGANNNKQMMLYALGALREYDYRYDIHTVRMTIYQPRLSNISSFEMSVEELKNWADSELKQRAELAWEGKGEYAPGEHCRFCKVKTICKALADYNLELAKYEFKDAHQLTDTEIADILTRADFFKNWISAIEEYALIAAIEEGKHWPGYKLVEGKSNRKYSDPDALGAHLINSGYSDDKIYTKSLLGITNMEKMLTKKVFEQVCGPFIIKPQGKPTLVTEADKRPEINSAAAAAKDFE